MGTEKVHTGCWCRNVKDSHLGDLGIDGRTISKWFFKTYKGWTGKGLIYFFVVKISRVFTGVLRTFGLTLL